MCAGHEPRILLGSDYLSRDNDTADDNKCVGRTHTIARLQTRIRRKDGTENFGGVVFVLDLV